MRLGPIRKVKHTPVGKGHTLEHPQEQAPWLKDIARSWRMGPQGAFWPILDLHSEICGFDCEIPMGVNPAHPLRA